MEIIWNKHKVNTAFKPKVFVAMSGGVDSSVAAFLLKQQGYEVIGVFMHSYNLDGCAEEDAEDARRAAEEISIPFYVWDFEKEYNKAVVDYMIQGYKKGITPNPDVMCNKEIKFGLFLKKALEMGGDYIATGHYIILKRFHFSKSRGSFSQRENDRLTLGLARSAPCPLGLRDTFFKNETVSLFAAKDQNKDQSYFLWTLTPEQLKYCLFPIGKYLKPEVRKIAKKAGLHNALKKDSQGICFLGKVSIRVFLKKYLPIKKGPILTLEGKKIGEHEGVWFYTIGQRHLGVKNYVLRNKGESETKPLFIAEKDIKKNALIVAEADNLALYKKEVKLIDVNLMNYEPRIINNESTVPVLARVRYRQPLTRASFIIHDSSFRLIFDKPQKFVAQGQSVVIYSKKGELLGGGVIL